MSRYNKDKRGAQFRHQNDGGKPKRLLTKEDLATIRRLNRERAKRMERAVARRLKASRTPMSGAGMIKGDGIIYLPNDAGIVVLECKLSSSTSEAGEPQIPFIAGWLTKLQKDVAAMRSLGARFGMLILKFHSYRDMYVMVHIDDLSLVEKSLDIRVPPHTDIMYYRATNKTGRARSTFNIERREIIKAVHGAYHMPNGIYRVFRFETIVDWFVKDTSE